MVRKIITPDEFARLNPEQQRRHRERALMFQVAALSERAAKLHITCERLLHLVAALVEVQGVGEDELVARARRLQAEAQVAVARPREKDIQPEDLVEARRRESTSIRLLAALGDEDDQDAGGVAPVVDLAAEDSRGGEA